MVLNAQCSNWLSVLAGIPQGSILGPLIFLIYINDLTEGLQSSVKHFADDTSLFSTVYDPSMSADQLDKDLKKISDWAYKWKMIFNPDLSKQAQEVIFSRKTNKINHATTTTFNTIPVARTPYQKNLGLCLDEKLNFTHHINLKISKANKGIGIIKRLSHILPRKSLITIYKSFFRAHLDYCDVIYDQPNNESFCSKIEQIQYNAALAITGAIRGTSQTKLYNELGLESLKFRRLCTFFKIKIYGKPEYLLNKIPSSQNHCNTRNADQVETYYCRTDFFNISFFPYTIIEWNKLDIDILKSKSYATFRNILLKLGRPIQRPIYSISSPVGLKLLTRLRLGLSHLNEHRFNHNFQNCINPLCSCSLKIESTSHFLLHCHHYTKIRVTLLNSIAEIIGNTFNINNDCLVNLLPFGSQKYTEIGNSHRVNAAIKYLLDSGRFNGPLL